MQEATPRPWHVEEAYEHETHLNDPDIPQFRGIFDADGFEVVNQYGFVSREHADLACLAVNEHDARVRVCVKRL